MHEFRHNRGYRTLILSALFNGIGDSLYNIVFIIYASTLPFKTLAVSLASMAGLLPGLLQILSGYFADATKRKVHGMWVALVVQAGLFLVLALAIRGTPSYELFFGLLALNILSDLLGQYGSGLQLPLFRHLIPAQELNSAMGFASAAQTTVQLIFQGVGASLIVLLHNDFALFGLINAVTFLVAAGVILSGRTRLDQLKLTPSQGPRTPMRQSILAALRFLKTQKTLLALILLACGFNFLGPATEALMAVTFLHAPHLIIGRYGTTVAVVNIVLSLGIVGGALFTHDGLDKLSFFTLLKGNSMALVALAGVFVVGRSRVLMVLLLFVTGYLLGKMNPRLSATLLVAVPEHQLAQVSSVIGMTAILAAPLGQVLFLGIANLIAPLWAWMLFGVIAFILLVAVMITARVVGPEQTIVQDT